MPVIGSMWESCCHLGEMRRLSWARWRWSEPCAFTGVVNLVVAPSRNKRISALFPVTDLTSWLVNPPSVLPQLISQQTPTRSSHRAAEGDQKLALILQQAYLGTLVRARGWTCWWGQSTQVEKAVLWLLTGVWSLAPHRNHPAESHVGWLEGTCRCFWTIRSPAVMFEANKFCCPTGRGWGCLHSRRWGLGDGRYLTLLS